MKLHTNANPENVSPADDDYCAPKIAAVEVREVTMGPSSRFPPTVRGDWPGLGKLDEAKGAKIQSDLP